MDTVDRITAWLIFFLLVCTAYTECQIISVVDESCGMSDCKCCATNQCSSMGHCLDGCKPGYHGGRCKSKCPDNCVTCTDHPDAGTDRPDLYGMGYCTACKEGHYLTDYLYQCQSTCSTGCKTCISGSNCTSCQTGHFLNIQNLGSCIVCPNECSSCSENIGCSSCMIGYYHTLSDGHGRCFKCLDNCISCESDVKCMLCNNGHYGTNCDKKCSNGCLTPCLKENGTCPCKPNFVGDTCDSCVTGNFGNGCTKGCPQNCHNNECDRLSGNCNACIGNHVFPKCEKCINGFHGVNCETKCPNNCMNKTCNQSTGQCILGCKGNFIGETCEECVSGKFGNECENYCLKMCLNICDMRTGHCLNCPSNFTGNTCEDCIIGVYGPDCNLSCPPNCQDNVCYRKDGTCKNGCTYGYSGNMCCLNNSFCDTCSSIHECDICIDGQFGYSCENNCSLNCNQNSCDKYNGLCNGCKDGFQGYYCEVPISKYCKQEKNNIAIPIVGTLSGIAVIFLIGTLIFFYLRRRASSNKQSKLENVYYNIPGEGLAQRDVNENAGQDLRRENQQLRQEISQLKAALNRDNYLTGQINTTSVYTLLSHANNGENPYSQIKTASVKCTCITKVDGVMRV